MQKVNYKNEKIIGERDISLQFFFFLIFEKKNNES